MTETHTAQVTFASQDNVLPGSGNWEEDFTPRSPLRQSGRTVAGPVFFALALMASTATAAIDPVPAGIAAPTSPVLTAPLRRAPTGRRISLKEARRIALQIMEDAEQERLIIAEEEAAAGIDWS